MSARARAWLMHPVLWVAAIYLAGVGLRVQYAVQVQPPETVVSSDMLLYVSLAKRLATARDSLVPADVTHPLGYPALLSFLSNGGEALGRAGNVQIVVSCLLPLALGLLGWAAFGKRTGVAAVAFASVYFPFIEYGALFLSEVHFITALALPFASFLAARRASRPGVAIALAVAGGLFLSIAAALKSVALPAAFAFFALEAVALVLERRPGGASLVARLKPWALRVSFVALAAAPLLGVLARECTHANRGKFCVTGNKVGADFLLGHYGRIADINWGEDED